MEGNIFVVILFVAHLFVGILSQSGNYTGSVYCTAHPNYPQIQGRGAGLRGSNDRNYIYQAKSILQQHVPCLQFNILPRGSTPTGDYVHIVKGLGCSSHVGRVGGRQQITLHSPGCISTGIIIHEMLHALGFEHEHERPDRDDYITVHYENISPGLEYNFYKQSWSRVSIYNEPYNYKSIMQYGSDFFSKNGKYTLTKKNGGIIEEGNELQDSDVRQLKAMYPCYD